uniref:Uncharacterized protein n=1 Tax=Oryza glumipatula TaxID=40148 RepID=A0A0D9YMR8_9ORYZ
MVRGTWWHSILLGWVHCNCNGMHKALTKWGPAQDETGGSGPWGVSSKIRETRGAMGWRTQSWGERYTTVAAIGDGGGKGCDAAEIEVCGTVRRKKEDVIIMVINQSRGTLFINYSIEKANYKSSGRSIERAYQEAKKKKIQEPAEGRNEEEDDEEEKGEEKRREDIEGGIALLRPKVIGTWVTDAKGEHLNMCEGRKTSRQTSGIFFVRKEKEMQQVG